MDRSAAPQPPSSLLEALRAAPSGPVAILIRHGDREHIPPGVNGELAPLVETGVQRARALGRALGPRPLKLFSSRIGRCIATAEALREGALGQPGEADSDWPEVQQSLEVGSPGLLVEDEALLWTQFVERGAEDVIWSYCRGEPVPGYRPVGPSIEGVLSFLARIVRDLRSEPAETAVLVSHDSLLMPLVALCFDHVWDGQWLGYLEGVVCWLDETGSLRIQWGDRQSSWTLR